MSALLVERAPCYGPVMTSEPRNVWNVGAELGEGPVWAEDALWFVDIKKQLVHRYEPASGGRRSWMAPEQVGFLFPAAGGGFVAGLQSGLFRFDPGSGGFDRIVEVEPGLPANRLNDGVVDPHGRLWFGTMDNNETDRTGAFYSYRRGKLARTNVTGIAITNGPAVSPDGRTLYWIDTRRGTLSAAAIGDDGGLWDSRLVRKFAPAEGHPDGPTIDAEGCVWISFYAGWEARRYSPAGELLSTVRFPTANITKLSFGGHDLRTAYATTARMFLRPGELARQPDAGALFEFRVDVPGIACPSVEL